MNNNERAKDLYFKAYSNSLKEQDAQAITYISVHYARFVAFKAGDVIRACDILD